MNEKKEKTSARPEKVFRRGAIAASVWRRQAPSGFEYFDFSLSRAWKAKSTGREGYSLNFFSDNEEDLAQVIRQASSWISEQLSDSRETDFDDRRDSDELMTMS
ncbi:MAG: hypothetical protein J0M26_06430 [Planctomycetes bacterium]|nr:hypothetical protein [Planctomycetota bacterium]